jgi:hypothetical protein
LQSTGITLDWAVTNVPWLDWPDPRNALHIQRILQEAFANIIKQQRYPHIVATAYAQGRILVTIRATVLVSMSQVSSPMAKTLMSSLHRLAQSPCHPFGGQTVSG